MIAALGIIESCILIKMIDKIKGELEKRTQIVDPKKPTAYAIFYNGRPLKLRSGKTVWRKIGHAKNALRNDLFDIVYRIPYKERNELWKEIFKLVEFKEVF